MALIKGANLNRCQLEAPEEILNDILANIEKAYRAGVIHSDLSEYNIMVEDGRCVIIDWPQWVEASHPNAASILCRDLKNILTFFKRKYRVKYDFEDAFRCVTG
jgi:RIO kinase 2